MEIIKQPKRRSQRASRIEKRK